MASSVRPPPGLLGAALLFWGWETELLGFGIAAAALVESAWLLKIRWVFAQPDLDRVWNLCVALFLGATVYAFLSSDNLAVVSELMKDNSALSRLATINQSKRSLFLLLQWLPMMFLPMVLAQVFGDQDRFDLSTFSWWLRRKRGERSNSVWAGSSLNVEFPYFACCVFAASAANQRTLWFSAGLASVIAWSLWLHRGAGFSSGRWVGSLLLALVLGGCTQLGLVHAQKLLQRLDEVLLARWGAGRNFDGNENQTRIGALGRLKLSGRILLRVKADSHNPPSLLREASYNVFRAPFWNASKRDFERVTPELNQSSWILHPGPAHGAVRRASIAGFLPAGTGLLALPSGVARLEQLPAMGVATNMFGSVRVEDGPGFVQIDAAYAEVQSIDSVPGREDREVPFHEQPVLSEVAATLRLDALSPEEATRVVERFFSENYTYSAWQGRRHRPNADRTALARFLLEHRTGHCEYFATATALLLRAAHIPTRYATGYSVQEKSRGYYVVRERHAHAWCLAWINNAWRDIDTTPVSWAAAEAQRASVLEPLRDLFSRLWFEFSKWRWGHTEWKHYLLWLIVPLLALAVGRVLLQRQWQRTRQKSELEATRVWPGSDSEFYAVERVLAKQGFARRPGETRTAWLDRLERSEDLLVGIEGLRTLVASHYKLRFDPRGLEREERDELRRRTSAWLQQAKLFSGRNGRLTHQSAQR